MKKKKKKKPLNNKTYNMHLQNRLVHFRYMTLSDFVGLGGLSVCISHAKSK